MHATHPSFKEEQPRETTAATTSASSVTITTHNNNQTNNSNLNTMKTLSAILCLCLLIVTVSQLGSSPVDAAPQGGHLRMLSAYPQARCLDGSPGAYYLFPGNSHKKVILHLEGGGLCPTLPTCLARSSTNLGSSTKYEAEKPASFLSGSLSRDCSVNPNFCAFSVIYLMYCDGGLYSSAANEPTTVNGTQLFFRGSMIRKAMVAELTKLINEFGVEELIYSGGSAGGLATFLHSSDDLLEIASQTKTLKKYGAMPESGYFPIVKNLLGQDVILKINQDLLSFTNATGQMNKACLAATPPAEQWNCGRASVAYNYSKVPTFALQSQYDQWQIDNELLATLGPNAEIPLIPDSVPGYAGTQCPHGSANRNDPPFGKCNSTQAAPLVAYNIVRELLLQSQTVANGKEKDGMFLISCFKHVAAGSDGYWSKTQIGGTPMNAAAWNWWNTLNTPQGNLLSKNQHIDCERSMADANRGYECNPTCLWSDKSERYANGLAVEQSVARNIGLL